MPKSKQLKKWRPKMMERYFHITETGRIAEDAWTDHPYDKKVAAFIGAFRTKREALARLKEVKKLLGIK